MTRPHGAEAAVRYGRCRVSISSRLRNVRRHTEVPRLPHAPRSDAPHAPRSSRSTLRRSTLRRSTLRRSTLRRSTALLQTDVLFVRAKFDRFALFEAFEFEA